MQHRTGYADRHDDAGRREQQNVTSLLFDHRNHFVSVALIASYIPARRATKTYAYHLFDYFSYLEAHHLDWRQVSNETVLQYGAAQDQNRNGFDPP